MLKSAQRGRNGNGGGGDGPLFVWRSLSSSSTRSTTKRRVHLILFSKYINTLLVSNSVLFFLLTKCDKSYEYKH